MSFVALFVFLEAQRRQAYQKDAEAAGFSQRQKPDNPDRPKVLGSKADLRLWSRIFDVQVSSRFS
jgi:hypothetical protein